MYRVMSSDEDSDDDIKHLLEVNSSRLQKVTKYALFYSSVIVTLISGEFYIITKGRDPSVLDIDPLRPEYVIVISETFMG